MGKSGIGEQNIDNLSEIWFQIRRNLVSMLSVAFTPVKVVFESTQLLVKILQQKKVVILMIILIIIMIMIINEIKIVYKRPWLCQDPWWDGFVINTSASVIDYAF